MAEEIPGRTGLTPGQKCALDSLVRYQAGSVVSRTLLSRRAGTVTLFAFDEGGGLSEHSAPFDALALVLEGTVVITISGESSTLNKGDAIILPAGETHSLRAAKQLKMLLTMIHE